MTFEAKYDGACGECEERILVGDLVTYAEDVLVHGDCEEFVRPERPTETCTKCWLVKPCDCEDNP
jgi:hypothetical protein